MTDSLLHFTLETLRYALVAAGLGLHMPALKAPPVPLVQVAAVEPRPEHAEFNGERASAEARLVADWATRSGDSQGLPFALLDKRDARVYVFDDQGRLRGASPVLLGLASGDDSVPGIGDKPLKLIKPHERTTPAGRFVAQRGHNTDGEDIVWVDYHNAISMHRVRPLNPKERRLERLASETPADNRISYGCINVPVKFYEQVLYGAMGPGRIVVYVLPETRSAAEVFGLRPAP